MLGLILELDILKKNKLNRLSRIKNLLNYSSKFLYIEKGELYIGNKNI